MKLAQCLQERADLNRKIAQLQSRLSNNATVQEGEKPAEDPKLLLKELNEAIKALEEVIAKINLCNSKTKVDGITLTELIAKKDTLTLKLSVYRQFLQEASQLSVRASRSEIKILSTIDITKTQKEVDAMAKELRLLENTIQETNWTTEL